MTFRAKPVGKRSTRPSWERESRRTLYLNLAFGAVIVAALAILVLAAGAIWWGDHMGSVATVNGTTISRDQFRARYAIESWRIDQAEAKLRDEFQAGRLSQTSRDSALSALEQQRQQLSQVALERLVDAELQRQLAAAKGITVSEADIDARLVEEATKKEQRRAWVIEVQPEVSSGATTPTQAQVDAAKAKADAALKDLQSGKTWDEVAKAVSTGADAAQAGDRGWIVSTSSMDETLRTALFALKANETTDVVKGADGTFRIGRVTDIAPTTTDANYTQKITDKGISLADYRKAVAADVLRGKLGDAVTASVVDTATPQRHVEEIYIAAGQGVGDEVHVKHILFSPNGNPDTNALKQLSDTDPAWDKAKAEAQAAYDQLKPFVGTPKLEDEFAALAKAKSNEPGAATSGGDLPFFARDQVDTGFGDAIFAAGLKKGDLLGPVRSQYGWHVILFEERRPDAQSRANDARLQVENGDFAAIAKQVSEGPEASKGGDLGWVARLQLSKTLEDAIFSTAVGKTSDVLSVPGDGFYVFKVVEEQTRTPDGDQKTKLQSGAFTNWYAAEKAKAVIQRNQDLPTPSAG